jgi:hypothetical protein
MVHFTGPGLNSYMEAARGAVHIQYHSEAAEAGIADLAQVRQKRGETIAEYIQRFREVKNQRYSTRITEK